MTFSTAKSLKIYTQLLDCRNYFFGPSVVQRAHCQVKAQKGCLVAFLIYLVTIDYAPARTDL